MSTRCPHCDQLLMEDEAVCWNCGRPTGLASVDREGEGAAHGAAEETAQQGGEQGERRPFSAVVIYVGLTAVVILGALLLTAFLGRQPRLQAASVQAPETWQRVTNGDETFTVFLPADWRFFDAGDAQQRDTLERLLAENALFREALHPWHEVRDVEVVFLATSDPPEAAGPPEELFIVARSAILNRLTYFELVSVVEQGDVIISSAEVVEDYDRRYAYVQLRTPEALRCQQQFILGEDDVLLAVFCARSEEPPATTLELLRTTFERLSD